MPAPEILEIEAYRRLADRSARSPRTWAPGRRRLVPERRAPPSGRCGARSSGRTSRQPAATASSCSRHRPRPGPRLALRDDRASAGRRGGGGPTPLLSPEERTEWDRLRFGSRTASCGSVTRAVWAGPSSIPTRIVSASMPPAITLGELRRRWGPGTPQSPPHGPAPGGRTRQPPDRRGVVPSRPGPGSTRRSRSNRARSSTCTESCGPCSTR